jgi:hypothetical protein
VSPLSEPWSLWLKAVSMRRSGPPRTLLVHEELIKTERLSDVPSVPLFPQPWSSAISVHLFIFPLHQKKPRITTIIVEELRTTALCINEFITPKVVDGKRSCPTASPKHVSPNWPQYPGILGGDCIEDCINTYSCATVLY